MQEASAAAGCIICGTCMDQRADHILLRHLLKVELLLELLMIMAVRFTCKHAHVLIINEC